LSRKLKDASLHFIILKKPFNRGIYALVVSNSDGFYLGKPLYLQDLCRKSLKVKKVSNCR